MLCSTITFICCPLILPLLQILIDFTFVAFIDSPSIWMYVLSPSLSLNNNQKGPMPCVTFAPDLTMRQRPRESSFLKATNSIFPSPVAWGQNSLSGISVATVLVSQTFLKPAMQLLEFRQTSPLYLFLKDTIKFYFLSNSMALVLFSSSSPKFATVSSELKECIEVMFSVKEAILRFKDLMGLRKLRKPMHPQSIRLTQAKGVRIFQTANETLASMPTPTQLAKAFLMSPYCLSTDTRSFMSQIFPSLYVYMLTSHMSYLHTLAPIHFFTCTVKFQGVKSKGLTGHPIVRQKSLPVPMGITPN